MLVDVTPSQEMVDEGIAREVVNKIQKLSKKVGLVGVRGSDVGRGDGREERREGRRAGWRGGGGGGGGGEEKGVIEEGGGERDGMTLEWYLPQAGLQPRDPVEVVYEVRRVEGGEGDGVTALQRIISEHSDYIESTTKGPVCPLTPDCDLRHVMVEEEQKVCVCVCGTAQGL